MIAITLLLLTFNMAMDLEEGSKGLKEASDKIKTIEGEFRQKELLEKPYPSGTFYEKIPCPQNVFYVGPGPSDALYKRPGPSDVLYKRTT